MLTTIAIIALFLVAAVWSLATVLLVGYLLRQLLRKLWSLLPDFGWNELPEVEWHREFGYLHELSGKDLYWELDSMSGVQFRKWCGYQFMCRGKEVALLRRPDVHGVDLIVEEMNQEVYVVCKRLAPTNRVSGPVIQLLVDGVEACGASRGILITTGACTRPAEKLALEKQIQIVARNVLPEFAEDTRRKLEDRQAQGLACREIRVIK